MRAVESVKPRVMIVYGKVNADDSCAEGHGSRRVKFFSDVPVESEMRARYQYGNGADGRLR